MGLFRERSPRFPAWVADLEIRQRTRKEERFESARSARPDSRFLFHPALPQHVALLRGSGGLRVLAVPAQYFCAALHHGKCAAVAHHRGVPARCLGPRELFLCAVFSNTLGSHRTKTSVADHGGDVRDGSSRAADFAALFPSVAPGGDPLPHQHGAGNRRAHHGSGADRERAASVRGYGDWAGDSGRGNLWGHADTHLCRNPGREVWPGNHPVDVGRWGGPRFSDGFAPQGVLPRQSPPSRPAGSWRGINDARTTGPCRTEKERSVPPRIIVARFLVFAGCPFETAPFKQFLFFLCGNDDRAMAISQESTFKRRLADIPTTARLKG